MALATPPEQLLVATTEASFEVQLDGEPEGEVEDDETFLRSIGDVYVHIDETELGLWFAEFQKLQEGDGLGDRDRRH